MKKFMAVAVVACGVALVLAANPAQAQRWGGRGGYGRGMGGSYGRGYGGYGWGGYGSGYTGYNGLNSGYYPSYGYNNSYYTPFAAANYGWPSAYNNTYGGSYTYQQDPSYGINSYVTPSSWDTSNPRYSMNARGLDNYRSFYSADQNTNANEATIRVMVPDTSARVYFDDTMTRQSGMDRVFTSPSLDSGKTYTYTVRATWMENGQEVNRSKDVKVQAGRQAMVDFRNTGDNRDGRDLRDDRRDENRDNRVEPGIPGNRRGDRPNPGISGDRPGTKTTNDGRPNDTGTTPDGTRNVPSTPRDRTNPGTTPDRPNP